MKEWKAKDCHTCKALDTCVPLGPCWEVSEAPDKPIDVMGIAKERDLNKGEDYTIGGPNYDCRGRERI